jgi:hypothetical protein
MQMQQQQQMALQSLVGNGNTSNQASKENKQQSFIQSCNTVLMAGSNLLRLKQN